jgi:hypothetical protein
MKTKIQLATVGFALLLAVFSISSCTSYKGIASKPDGHNRYHRDLALNNLFKKHGGNSANHDNTQAKASANNTVTPVQPAPASLNQKTATEINSMTASSSNEVPALKNPKEFYQLLTTEERVQAKEAVDKIFAKRHFLKKIVDARLNNMNEKYPAAAQSTLHRDNGGALSTAEILSIVAIACSVTWILGLAGLIIGIIALQRIRAEGGADWARILAIVAIVLGAIDVVSLFLWILFMIVIHL